MNSITSRRRFLAKVSMGIAAETQWSSPVDDLFASQSVRTAEDYLWNISYKREEVDQWLALNAL